jgi:phasin family protein
MEETMTQDVQTLIDVLRKFGSDLGLPKLDVDQLIKTQRSNLDAFAQATQIAAEGAASIAKKQREVLAAGLREASELAHEYKPSGSPQEMLAKQAEFANKALDITVQNARDVSELASQSTSEAVGIIRKRLRESWDEILGVADTAAAGKKEKE